MSIEIKINTELSLRACGAEGKHPHECLPVKLHKDVCYFFKEEGQIVYQLHKPIKLLESNIDRRKLSTLVAVVEVEQLTHKQEGLSVWTTGRYRVIEKCKKDRIYFDGSSYISGGEI